MSARQDRHYSQAWRNGTKVVLPPLIKSVMKRDWQGYQHFPREGGMLVAANHLSYADWPAMSLFVHEAGRYPAFMIKSSAFDVKLIGPFLRVLGQLPVRRGEADAANVLKVAEQALAAGECVIIYPEGTATRDPDQWPMVAKTGVARLALATGVPVIPVAQWGAQDILPYGEIRPHAVPRKLVRMLAGPPVDLSEYEGKPLTRRAARGHERDRPTLPSCWPSCAAGSRRPRPTTRPWPAARRARPPGSRPYRVMTRTRRRRREGGGHGGRHVGHHLRPGALRRRHPGQAVGPAARPGRDDQRAAREPGLPPGHHPAGGAGRQPRADWAGPADLCRAGVPARRCAITSRPGGICARHAAFVSLMKGTSSAPMSG
jgi:1-acyl-sn-glycerol-3-phosphate acyltransferase